MKDNMISIDATYFYEKAVQAMERFQFDKAIKHFRKVVQLEPMNAVHYCNLAGALAESGRFHESNEWLSFVLETLEPKMTECHFYRANNYANLEMWDQAEQEIIAYLERDEDGHYLEECQELLEIFAVDLKRPAIRIEHIKSRQGYAEHDTARKLLEVGKFKEASDVLRELLTTDPDFLPARNNLALACYYLGQYEEAEQHIQTVLDVEPDNLHALCNHALILHHFNDQRRLRSVIQKLSKYKPIYADQMFKLATTMGMLQHHETAYRLFRAIVKNKFEDIEIDACFFHYTAVSAFHLGEFEEARRWWVKAQKIEPQSQVLAFYLYHINQWLGKGVQPPASIAYDYQLPFSDLLRKLHSATRAKRLSEVEQIYMIDSFSWALQHAESDVRKLVTEGLLLIGNEAINSRLVDLGLMKESKIRM
jgi:tetratricopeptide (TPR) repeat protein